MLLIPDALCSSLLIICKSLRLRMPAPCKLLYFLLAEFGKMLTVQMQLHLYSEQQKALESATSRIESKSFWVLENWIEIELKWIVFGYIGNGIEFKLIFGNFLYFDALNWNWIEIKLYQY